jgi:hypothetical protein
MTYIAAQFATFYRTNYGILPRKTGEIELRYAQENILK